MNSKHFNAILGAIVFVLFVSVVALIAQSKYSKIFLVERQDEKLGIAQVQQVVTEDDEYADDEESEWQGYINDQYGFSISYPFTIESEEGIWVNEDVQFKDFYAAHFGTPDSKQGGYIWAVKVYDKGVVKIEDLIAEFGGQFSDRQETRKNIIIDGTPAVLVSVTTKQVDNWISRDVIFEKNGKIYVIADGADQYPEFVTFYNSFRFIK